jgi:hypothetical protein
LSLLFNAAPYSQRLFQAWLDNTTYHFTQLAPVPFCYYELLAQLRGDVYIRDTLAVAVFLTVVKVFDDLLKEDPVYVL